MREVIGRTLRIVTICAMASVGTGRMAYAAESADTSQTQASVTPRVAALPSVKELPSPFTFADGSPVKSPEDWPRRRKELLGLFLKYEYGALPPPSEVKAHMDAAAHPSTQPSLSSATEEQLTLTMGPKGEVTTKLLLTIPPTTAEHKPPFPVIVRGDLCWGRVKPEILQEVVSRGYILAEFDRTMIAADKIGRGNGVYAAYPDFDGGCLSAWAWGFSRVTDYLLTRPDVDAKRVVFTGHSRGGKACLLAGALDERAAIVVPNGSGCGGAGCYRIQPPKTEDLARITHVFPFWFEPTFNEFAGHEDHLPFDQHELKACVAPRALLETSAIGDVWANGPGTQATHEAAAEVFQFLVVPQRLGIHWRPGKHEHNLVDWTALLDFADAQFTGKAPAQNFDQRQFADQAKAYSWKAP